MTPRSIDLYRHELAAVRVLDRETERDLAIRARGGDRLARDRIVESCLPFVLSIANEHRRWGVALEDLVQQGNVGLVLALERFDPERGVRLATFAAPWIRGEIRGYAVASHRIVRLGKTDTERAAVRAWHGGRARTGAELAEQSGMPIARAERLFALLAHRDVSLDEDLAIERHPIDRGSPEEALADGERARAIAEAVPRALAALDARARRIVEARFLADDPPTRVELGREMGVSRERIRQLESRARDQLARALAALSAA